jgi:hypothetical protein
MLAAKPEYAATTRAVRTLGDNHTVVIQKGTDRFRIAADQRGGQEWSCQLAQEGRAHLADLAGGPVQEPDVGLPGLQRIEITQRKRLEGAAEHQLKLLQQHWNPLGGRQVLKRPVVKLAGDC